MSINTFDLTAVEGWVEYIQTLHAREIDLSLERTNQVYRRLLPHGIEATVIAVAGTNGKGSTAELISSCYRSAGYRVGKYTSPHLLRFNERIEINGQAVNDEDLLEAFTLVESLRETTPLTYFEFGTLVALHLMKQQKVDVAVLEVGLGGRLDAVNVVDSDVAIITSISIDHTAWLGKTLSSIAYEKAGIVRKDKPAILGTSPELPALTEACEARGAHVYQLGKHFFNDRIGDAPTWQWSDAESIVLELPLPFEQVGIQLNNAACAVQALKLLEHRHPISQDVVKTGIASAKMRGRCQIVNHNPLTILDVAHNEDSVRALARFVNAQRVKGRVRAVCGMLKDKEIGQSLSQLAPSVHDWHVASISGQRGASAQVIGDIVRDLTAASNNCSVLEYAHVSDAYQAALAAAHEDDCIVVFGSFYIVADILPLFE